MRIDRNLFNWGIFFICLGLVPFAVEQGLLSRNVAAQAWTLWPLFLVALGVALVLSRTPARLAGGALVAACFGLILGGAVSAAPGFAACRAAGGGAYSTQSGTLTTPASVNIDLSCGSAQVSTGAGNGWSATTSDAGKPTITSAGDRLSVATGDRGWFFDRSADDWRITLPESVELNLTASVNAADSHLNLSNANLSAASLSVNAASTHVDLTAATVKTMSLSVNAGSASLTLDTGSAVNGSVSANLGSVEICAASGTALRIELKEALAGNNLSSAGLDRNGDVWTTPGFGTQQRQVDLRVSTNLGSLTLNPTGGCK